MRFIKYFFIAFCIISLASCTKPTANTLIIGTVAGPETDLVQVAKEVALKKYGLNLKIVAFNDYNLPNAALEEGSLDANVYQHLPYLKASSQAHGYHLEVIGKTFVYPTGIYSSHYKRLNELPKKAVIAIPNDPSNETRALQLLQKADLIKLKSTESTTLEDITSNPKELVFKELDAAQLPRVLPDVAAAVINTTFAIPAGLNPTKDALFTEDKNSPYANLIVIKEGNPKKDLLTLLVKALNSSAVKAKAKELFGSAAIVAWNNSK